MDVFFDYIYQINWFAVVVAACVGMLISAAWYSDALFGKTWRKSAGLKKKDIEKQGTDVAIVISLVLLLITSATIAVLVDVLKVSGGWSGLLLGVLVGLGFLVTNNGMHKLYEQRPFSLFAISTVGDMLTVVAISVILAIW
jgi:RsiW-degrading membrane proteinase PrsW (M82 family)